MSSRASTGTAWLDRQRSRHVQLARPERDGPAVQVPRGVAVVVHLDPQAAPQVAAGRPGEHLGHDDVARENEVLVDQSVAVVVTPVVALGGSRVGVGVRVVAVAPSELVGVVAVGVGVEGDERLEGQGGALAPGVRRQGGGVGADRLGREGQANHGGADHRVGGVLQLERRVAGELDLERALARADGLHAHVDQAGLVGAQRRECTLGDRQRGWGLAGLPLGDPRRTGDCQGQGRDEGQAMGQATSGSVS